MIFPLYFACRVKTNQTLPEVEVEKAEKGKKRKRNTSLQYPHELAKGERRQRDQMQLKNYLLVRFAPSFSSPPHKITS